MLARNLAHPTTPLRLQVSFVIFIERFNGYMYTSLHARWRMVQICLGSAWDRLKSLSCVLLSAACASCWTELAKPEHTRCGICSLE